MDIIYIPAECDASCFDRWCPYTHRDTYQYKKLDGTLSDGYGSEEAAINAANNDPQAKP